jgi:ubiquinone/menaquinone biosynthesis C-methylase UbiE
VTTPVERYEREEAFHDDAFSESTRRRAGKFYVITRASHLAYEAVLASASGPGKRALEYGCGRGSYAFDLAETGCTTTGIDLSIEGLRQAQGEAQRRGLEGIDFKHMNAEALDYPNASFDLVCGSGVLHHLDLDQGFREVSRVLKPGGTAVFIEPLGHNPAINLYRRLTPKLRTEDEHPLLVEDLKNVRKNFGTSRMQYFHLFTLAAVPLRGTAAFEPVLRLLSTLDGAIFALVPPARRFAWIVVITLRLPRPVSQE